MDDLRDRPALLPPGVRVLRLGPGANCSSIGSVIDVLFASAAVGGAVTLVLASLGVDSPTPSGDEAAGASAPDLPPAPPAEPER